MPGSWKITCTVVDPTGKAVASDQITVYVLWVDLELLSSGACPDEDNEARMPYLQRTRPAYRDALGLGDFASGRHGWGVATHGTVTPSEWPDPLALRQYGSGFVYHGENGDEVKYVLDGEDTEEQLLDETPPHIYYMDYPGMRYTGDPGVHRMRCNFSDLVYMAQQGGRVCSNTVQWSTAQSWHWDGGAQAWCTFTDPQVATTPGDNNLWVGSQLSAAERDWDMQ